MLTLLSCRIAYRSVHMHTTGHECNQITTKYVFSHQLYRQGGRTDTLAAADGTRTGLQRQHYCSYVRTQHTDGTFSFVPLSYTSVGSNREADTNRVASISAMMSGDEVSSPHPGISLPFQLSSCWRSSSPAQLAAGSRMSTSTVPYRTAN